MARVVGVDLPRQKRVEVALTSIYGIGPSRAAILMDRLGIPAPTRVHELTDEQASQLTALIQNEFRVEGELRREVASNVKRLMEINCYRGQRHKRSLPVRGQRTHTNARTRKGPRRTAGKKK